MNEEIKQEIAKNFTKVNDYIMEATKREMAKTCQDGGFLDHSLYALVAKHDVEQEFEKLIKTFELIDEELSNFTPNEQIIVLDGLRKSPIKEFKVSCYAVYPFGYLENIEWREEPEYIKTYDQIMEDLRLDIERDL